ncbi:SGNH/GDSL hydrolase family protein [Nocardioides marmorisolisilvae]|uniref:SGNH/GDSL hydrolase family protein n=1 Tax=Nocardioides marmorisolisilvae TaxID=1542737 RepID=UPI001C839237|nr:SGNH/GDSL hydrolase family protein [Nocardioides marmorisolisilvae]
MSLGARRHLGWLSAGLGVLLAALALTPLIGGTAQASTAERCARFTHQSLVRQHVVTGRGATTVVIGDSYSAGLGLQHPDRNWARELPGRVHVFGFSGSGFSRGASPCKDVAYDQRARTALALHPSLVVVEGGLNDFDQPSGQIRAGFRRLVAEIGGDRLLVVGPPPAPLRGARAARVDAILRSEAARSGTPYLSMIDDRFTYLPDRLHLTPLGHERFGTVVADALDSP